MSKYKFSGSGVAAMVALLMACCGSAVSLGQEDSAKEDLAKQERWYRLVCIEDGKCYDGYGESYRSGQAGIQEACQKAQQDAEMEARKAGCSDYIAVPQDQGTLDVCWTEQPGDCQNVSSSSLESEYSGWVALANCCVSGDKAMGVGRTRAKARLDARRKLRKVFGAHCKLRAIHYKLTPIGSGASSCD